MIKRLCLFALMLALAPSALARAVILPATGVDEGFKGRTGLTALPAVVLCESLSICDAREGRAIDRALYSQGKTTLPVLEYFDGWAQIYADDGQSTAWVRTDYLLIDPAWYICDADTQVYAYDDMMSPRVALLPAGARLPIIKETDGWVLVSLRAAAGWIRKTPADTAHKTAFRPELLAGTVGASLQLRERTAPIRQEDIQTLIALLTHAEDLGGEMAACPFSATLTLTLADSQTIALQVANDSCCVYRVDGRDYKYARNIRYADRNVTNEVLYDLFGLSPF